MASAIPSPRSARCRLNASVATQSMTAGPDGSVSEKGSATTCAAAKTVLTESDVKRTGSRGVPVSMAWLAFPLALLVGPSSG